MLYDIKMESMPREELKALQLKRLQDVANRVYYNVPFYHKRFDELGVKPTDIRSLDDIRRLPFTTKQDLRDRYPLGFMAVPRENIARLHASSGTTGQAVVGCYTKRDLKNWARMGCRCLMASGVTPQDLVHVAYGYGLFTGGLGLHDAATELGCTVVPASGGSTRRQTVLIRDLGATVLACTPSYALHLYEVGLENGIDFKKLPLRVGIFGGEPWSKAMRQEMEENMGIDTHNIYGLSEIMGPGVAIDCSEHNGLHLWEDHFIAEIVDPATGEPVPEGELGELVLTNLTKEGSPLIRYRTRDLTRILPGKCPCGRTHLRIDRIKGRSDDMFIIKGVNIFPMQVEKILVQFPELGSNYLITLETVNNQDEMIVEVELSDLSTDNYIELEKIRRDIIRQLKDEILVTPKVKLVKKGSLPQSEGKAVRVKDVRDNK